MKKVVSNAMVAHLWANQSQTEARNSNGSIFFEGTCIYSYRRSFKIGEIVTAPNGQQFYFVHDHSPSQTTWKHINLVKRAISSDCIVVDVNMFDKCFGILNSFNAANAYKSAEYLRDSIISKINLQSRARVYNWIPSILSLYSQYKTVSEAWFLPFIELANFPNYTKAQKKSKIIEETQRQKNAQREREREERNRKQREEEYKKLDKWLKNELNEALLNIPIHLRMSSDGSTIQTTRGASVPVGDAIVLWEAIQEGRDVKGMKVGSFTCISVLNGIIKIGCHEIPMHVAAHFMTRMMETA